MSRPGPKPHPWRSLVDAALAFAAAETDDEFRRASWRLAKAAVRYRKTPRRSERPASEEGKAA
jgi:hypothetical protein